MTAPSKVVPEAACSQVFTRRYDEFTFRNDTVTAFHSDDGLRAKPMCSPERGLCLGIKGC